MSGRLASYSEAVLRDNEWTQTSKSTSGAASDVFIVA